MNDKSLPEFAAYDEAREKLKKARKQIVKCADEAHSVPDQDSLDFLERFRALGKEYRNLEFEMIRHFRAYRSAVHRKRGDDSA